MNSVTTNNCCQLAILYCDLGCRMFWGARSGSYKWQDILIATFSSQCYFAVGNLCARWKRGKKQLIQYLMYLTAQYGIVYTYIDLFAL